MARRPCFPRIKSGGLWRGKTSYAGQALGGVVTKPNGIPGSAASRQPRNDERGVGGYAAEPWQCLYFLPEPQGQGALRGVDPHVSGFCGSNTFCTGRI